MHPFPTSEKLQFLLAGHPILSQIGVNPYGVKLVLDNGCSITSEGKLTYVDPEGSHFGYEREWRNEAPIRFHALLEQRLVLIDSEQLSLFLKFEKGALMVHSELGPYESGQIHSADGSCLVF